MLLPRPLPVLYFPRDSLGSLCVNCLLCAMLQFLSIEGLVEGSAAGNATQEPKGKCPFPFVMLHDPVGGAKDHPGKLALAVLAIAYFWIQPKLTGTQ